MTRLWWLLALALGCRINDLDYTGKQCPCPTGWSCAPATNTCMRGVAVDATSSCAVDPGATAVPTLVQAVTGYAAAGATLSVTLAPPVPGDELVIVGAAINAALTSVTGGGATWTRATRSTNHTNIEVWYGISDGTGTMVTIGLPNNNNRIWMLATEWSHLGTLDLAGADAGVIAPASAGPITTSNPSDLLIFGVADRQGAMVGSPSDGAWKALPGIAMGVTQDEWCRVVASPGTFDPQVPDDGNEWDAAIAAFKIGG